MNAVPNSREETSSISTDSLHAHGGQVREPTSRVTPTPVLSDQMHFVLDPGRQTTPSTWSRIQKLSSISFGDNEAKSDGKLDGKATHCRTPYASCASANPLANSRNAMF